MQIDHIEDAAGAETGPSVQNPLAEIPGPGENKTAVSPFFA
eukprot:SAG31_NODE_16116_length_722_cov_0.998395_1_plen_40_part_10